MWRPAFSPCPIRMTAVRRQSLWAEDPECGNDRRDPAGTSKITKCLNEEMGGGL